VVIARPEAVLKDEGRDPERVEPLGDLSSFVVAGHDHVAAARAHDDPGSVGLSRGRAVDRDLRLVQRFAAQCPRRAIRPQKVGLAISVGRVHGADLVVGVTRRRGELRRGWNRRESENREEEERAGGQRLPFFISESR
jgi:hypothetical protein